MKPEIIQLIGKALDETISPEDFAVLQDHLRHDPEAMTLYCQQAEIHGRLTWELQVKPESVSQITSQVSTPPLHQSPRFNFAGITAIAAAITLLGVSAYFLTQQISPPAPSPTLTSHSVTPTHHPEDSSENKSDPGSFSSIARITNMQDARWKENDLKIGSWLTPSIIHLLSGQAEVTFDSGARIILQGPATLDCVTPRLASLTQGKGVVHIPREAEGFRLKTPSSSFTDPSCSFALAVDDGGTEIHVFKGNIQASPRSNTALSQTLQASQSLRLNLSTMLASNTLRYTPKTFHQEIPITSHHLKTTFLRWSFDTMQMGTFPETGHHPRARYPAQIQQLDRLPGEAQAQSIKGKFGRALRFNGQGSYLSTPFTGISGSDERTVSCWVRIPKHTHPRHAYSLFSWGEPQSQTGTKWQISWNPAKDNRGVYGAIRTEFGGGYVIGSTDLRDGRWHHITSVYLGGSSEIVATQILHYIDGKLETVTASKHQTINTQTSSKKTSLAYIGRRLENDVAFSSFKGDIDELHVFPAALTPHQIQMLYKHNQTPQNLIPSLVHQ